MSNENIQQDLTKSERKRSRKHWSKEDVKNLMFYFRIEGSKWSKIVVKFPGMTENDIKNKFYSTLKSAANKLQIPLSRAKHKDELTKLVDVVLIYDQLLPCINNPKRARIKRLKRGRLSSQDANQTNKQRTDEIEIWSALEAPINSAIATGFERMIWEENEEKANLNAGINKTFTSYQETRLNLADKDFFKR